MNLLVIRHADALPLGEAGTKRDEERPLSELGRRQAQALAEALRQLGHVPACLFSSPLVRAVETAAPLRALLAGADPYAEIDELTPEAYRPKALAKRVLTAADGATVALVGHNPSVSDFVRWLTGAEKETLDLPKGGAAWLECGPSPRKGEAVLKWAVSPEWYLRM